MSEKCPDIWTEYIDIRLVSEVNVREHYSIKSRRLKEHHKASFFACKKFSASSIFSFPCTVRLIRIYGPCRRKFDENNLKISFSAVRNGIVACLGVKEDDERISWEYDQRQGSKDLAAISIWKTPNNIQLNTKEKMWHGESTR